MARITLVKRNTTGKRVSYWQHAAMSSFDAGSNGFYQYSLQLARSFGVAGVQRGEFWQHGSFLH
jgi:hypothetical protein